MAKQTIDFSFVGTESNKTKTNDQILSEVNKKVESLSNTGSIISPKLNNNSNQTFKVNPPEKSKEVKSNTEQSNSSNRYDQANFEKTLQGGLKGYSQLPKNITRDQYKQLVQNYAKEYDLDYSSYNDRKTAEVNVNAELNNFNVQIEGRYKSGKSTIYDTVDKHGNYLKALGSDNVDNKITTKKDYNVTISDVKLGESFKLNGLMNFNSSLLNLNNSENTSDFSQINFNFDTNSISNNSSQEAQVSLVEATKGLGKLIKSSKEIASNSINYVKDEISNFTKKVANFKDKYINAETFYSVEKKVSNFLETSQSLLANAGNYEHYLTQLDSKVDPTDRSESFEDFSKKLFSKETANELGSVLVDELANLGDNLIKSLIPKITIKNNQDSFEDDLKKYYVRLQTYLIKNRGIEDLEIKDSNISKVLGDLENYSRAQVIDNPKDFIDTVNAAKIVKWNYGSINGLADQIELKILQKLNVSTNHNIYKSSISLKDSQGNTTKTIQFNSDFTRQDQSQMFKNLVSKNPLLGQHQFMLTLPNMVNTQVVKDLDYSFIENQLANFRVQSLKIPDVSRINTSNLYGNSIINQLPNLQANLENKAELNIICDRNLNTLDYLIRLTGLGLQEAAEDDQIVYNLSTITNSNFSRENTIAKLSILNGRDLAKAIYMENPEWMFDKQSPTAKNLEVNYNVDTLAETESPTRENVLYAKLPEFVFENFRVVNLDYSFKLATSSLKLLEIKALCTWTKMYINWVDTSLLYYDTLS